MPKVKESHLIAYHLFCNLKKFSLRNYLQRNKNIKYEDFKDFLINKKVQPPNKDYFDLVKKSLHNEFQKNEIQEKEVVQEKKQDVPKLKKPKRKRKKSSNETSST